MSQPINKKFRCACRDLVESYLTRYSNEQMCESKAIVGRWICAVYGAHTIPVDTPRHSDPRILNGAVCVVWTNFALRSCCGMHESVFVSVKYGPRAMAVYRVQCCEPSMVISICDRRDDRWRYSRCVRRRSRGSAPPNRFAHNSNTSRAGARSRQLDSPSATRSVRGMMRRGIKSKH